MCCSSHSLSIAAISSRVIIRSRFFAKVARISPRYNMHFVGCLLTSQLPVKNWYDILAKNTTVADAVLDRLAKTAHRIELSGDSMRK
ncbi:MAG: ATP-binding protein [Bacteroidales bacterium]|nr:ATP-binding protein [Bacteroidales bacterium]